MYIVALVICMCIISIGAGLYFFVFNKPTNIKKVSGGYFFRGE
jgi:hypothetical protein